MLHDITNKEGKKTPHTHGKRALTIPNGIFAPDDDEITISPTIVSQLMMQEQAHVNRLIGCSVQGRRMGKVERTTHKGQWEGNDMQRTTTVRHITPNF